MTKPAQTVDDLQRPEWNGLEENYDVHDIGEAHIRRKCEHVGLRAESWGIDKRHASGELIYDDKMDLKVFGWEDDSPAPTPPSEEEGVLAGVIEIKTKRNEDWFGTINRRHWKKYVRHVHQLDVPAYVYMSLVDDEKEAVVRDTFIPVQPWDELQRVLEGEYDFYPPRSADQFLDEQIDTHPQVEATWRAPDGNLVVDLDVDTGVDWRHVSHRLVGTPTSQSATETATDSGSAYASTTDDDE